MKEEKSKVNLDPLMKRFRIASRELYNNHFIPSSHEDFDAWHASDYFYQVEEALFQALVINPSPLSPACYGVLNSEIEVTILGEYAPILINRQQNKGHGYWDYPVEKVTKDCHMIFEAFFDFDSDDFADHRYAKVKIESWPTESGTEGYYALIETQYISFAMRGSQVIPQA